MAASGNRRKVVVLGLDGATFRVLRPLVERGVVPTISRFMREGSWGTLRTTRPPVTCPAWPTMFTGVNPGRHGVYSFSYRDPKTKRMRTASSGDIGAPKIWNLIGDAGQRVCVLNVPITFPAEPVNGVMLTGFVSPDESPYITHPRSLAQELRDQFGDISLNWSVLNYRPADPAERENHIRRINDLMLQRCRQFEHIAKTNDAELCFLVHEYTDRVQHLFYHILDPEYSAHHDPRNRNAQSLLYEGFRALDESLGRMMAHFGPEADFMIVSDHGFDGVGQWVYVNNFLERHGLLSVRGAKCWGELLARRLHLSDRLCRRLGLQEAEVWHRQDPSRMPLVDYSRTTAFAGPQLEHSIYINAKDRFGNGTVDPGDSYETVLKEVMRLITEARDPRTGGPVFEGVWRGSDLYQGEFAGEAPDLIYEMAPGYMVSNALPPPGLLGSRFLRPLRGGYAIAGYHRPEGVFLGCGPSFGRAENLDADILDIAPTVLYLLGLPVPNYMDGNVLERALDPDRLRMRQPEKYDVDLVRPRATDVVYTEAEQSEVTRRLEELGYL